jgi:hypothetical protein
MREVQQDRLKERMPEKMNSLREREREREAGEHGRCHVGKEL